MNNELYNIRIKDIVVYTGLLNSHEDYLKMLDILEEKTSFIGITSDHKIIKKLKKDILNTEKTNKWWGTETSYIETIYYIKTSKELFELLRKYETFCRYIIDYNDGDRAYETSFGSNDIAFFDKDNNILLCTTTHEGDIYVTKEIDKLFR